MSRFVLVEDPMAESIEKEIEELNKKLGLKDWDKQIRFEEISTTREFGGKVRIQLDYIILDKGECTQDYIEFGRYYPHPIGEYRGTFIQISDMPEELLGILKEHKVRIYK